MDHYTNKETVEPMEKCRPTSIICYHVAIDIGASSGRHMLIYIDEQEELNIEEIYRFKNGLHKVELQKKEIHKKEEVLCWDHDYLYEEILNGLSRCKEIGKCPSTVSIDTWGVDFVLLDDCKKIIGNTVSYRDHRTLGMIEAVEKIIGTKELYARTGIYPASFNTIYQLMSLKLHHPEELEKAQHLLMTPDYFSFRLTGKLINEYTIASTSALVDVATRQWDQALLDRLGLPKRLFGTLTPPAVAKLPVSAGVAAAIGFDVDLVVTTCHDTASAVLAVPAEEEDYIFLSSGTWSLLGVETVDYNCSQEGFEAGFTNEGGYGGTYRYLRNIMGLWMIQEVRKELLLSEEKEYTFEQLGDLAKECSSTAVAYVDVNDTSFMAPKSMIQAIKDYCSRTGQQVPNTPGELSNVIYHSLAKCYKEAVEGLERIQNKIYSCIHIVGGGSNASYLNELTKQYTGKKVYAGPSEATAIGNAIGQMLACGEIKNLREGRRLVSSYLKRKELSKL